MHCISEDALLPVSIETAFHVLSDLQTILRLSPYHSVKDFKVIPAVDNQPGPGYQVVLEEYASREISTCLVTIAENVQNEKIHFAITQWKVQEVVFSLARANGGVKLSQQFLVCADDDLELQGLRNELVHWLRSIGEYLKLADGKRLDKIVPKWFMDYVWLRLSLAERKIAIILVTFSMAEILLLVVLVIAWNLFVSH